MPKEASHPPKPNKTEERPCRPFTAYNLFFCLEKERILQEQGEGHASCPPDPRDQDQDGPSRPAAFRHLILPKDWYLPKPSRKKRLGSKRNRNPPHRVISFVELSKAISAGWKLADAATKSYCTEIAAEQLDGYVERMEAFVEKYGEVAAKAPKKTCKKKQTKATKTKCPDIFDGQSDGTKLASSPKTPAITRCKEANISNGHRESIITSDDKQFSYEDLSAQFQFPSGDKAYCQEISTSSQASPPSFCMPTTSTIPRWEEEAISKGKRESIITSDDNRFLYEDRSVGFQFPSGVYCQEIPNSTQWKHEGPPSYPYPSNEVAGARNTTASLSWSPNTPFTNRSALNYKNDINQQQAGRTSHFNSSNFNAEYSFRGRSENVPNTFHHQYIATDETFHNRQYEQSPSLFLSVMEGNKFPSPLKEQMKRTSVKDEHCFPGPLSPSKENGTDLGDAPFLW